MELLNVEVTSIRVHEDILLDLFVWVESAIQDAFWSIVAI
jgi:hypothetical protein